MCGIGKQNTVHRSAIQRRTGLPVAQSRGSISVPPKVSQPGTKIRTNISYRQHIYLQYNCTACILVLLSYTLVRRKGMGMGMGLQLYLKLLICRLCITFTRVSTFSGDVLLYTLNTICTTRSSIACRYNAHERGRSYITC